MDLKYGIIIRRGAVHDIRFLGPSYEFVASASCPLGNKACRYVHGQSTFCTHSDSISGMSAVCICACGKKLQTTDVAKFGDVIENFAGCGVAGAIMQKLENTKSGR